jgi:hypothetical protein
MGCTEALFWVLPTLVWTVVQRPESAEPLEPFVHWETSYGVNNRLAECIAKKKQARLVHCPYVCTRVSAQRIEAESFTRTLGFPDQHAAI